MSRLAFSPCGTVLASGGNDATVRVRRVGSDSPPDRLAVKDRYGLKGTWTVTRLAFLPGRRTVALVVAPKAKPDEGGGLVWDRTDDEARPLGGGLAAYPARDLAAAPDGSAVAVASVSDQVVRFDPNRPAVAAGVVPAGGRGAFAAGYHPGGGLVVASADVGGATGSLAVHRVGPGVPERVTRTDAVVRAVTFSPAGDLVATVDDAYRLVVRGWPALDVVWEEASGSVVGAAFTPDGTGLLTHHWDPFELRAWAAATGEPGGRHRTPATAVAVSPDGRTVATGDADGRVRLVPWVDLFPGVGPVRPDR